MKGQLHVEPRVSVPTVVVAPGGTAHRVIGRRSFLRLAGFLPVTAIGVCGTAVLAQLGAEKPKRVGVIVSSASASGIAVAPWLAELGYRDGENIQFESRFAAGRDERLPEFAADLVRRGVDVIVASGLPAIRAAREATRTIPIVMIAEGDPVKAGFVASVARPGGNLTGVTLLVPELSAKRLEILKAMVPGLKRVAVLWNPADPDKEEEWRAIEAAARTLEIELQPVPARKREELDGAFGAAIKGRANAMLVLSDALVLGQARSVTALAQEKRLPAMYPSGYFTDPAQSGLASYGPNLVELSRRAATFVDRILKGAKPAELAIEQPTRIELVINMRAAKAIGLRLPPAVLVRAERVIE
ncbi:MAG TPA: ABC transporter substrate-binding protein [Burkholderiales bacterium]|nr:ABC transporter substrate-binding protein [Burkholderiales bacterium]